MMTGLTARRGDPGGRGMMAVWAGFAVLVFAAATHLGASGALAAGPSCHCFRDRDYDSANPGKSDEYLLATAANTLLSAAYGVPKREIVQARMSGTSGEDLWVGAFAAHRLRADEGALLKARAAAAQRCKRRCSPR